MIHSLLCLRGRSLQHVLEAVPFNTAKRIIPVLKRGATCYLHTLVSVVDQEAADDQRTVAARTVAARTVAARAVAALAAGARAAASRLREHARHGRGHRRAVRPWLARHVAGPAGADSDLPR